MFKKTTEKVLNEGKERSDKIRRNVMKNLDEAAVAAIQKMDRGQEAIQVVGEFAKAKLQTAGKKARTFLSNKCWSCNRFRFLNAPLPESFL